MEHVILILTIFGVHIFVWFTPGPMAVLIMRNSLMYSRAAGLWTAAGIMTGNLFHLSYAAAAAIFLIPTSDIALTIMKFLGVGYLMYLGVKTVVSKVQPQDIDVQETNKDISALSAFMNGFIANLLSPTALLFFASIIVGVFTLGVPMWVIIFLIIMMPVTSFAMASLLTIVLTQKKVQSAYSKHQNILNKILGFALVILAIMIALYRG